MLDQLQPSTDHQITSPSGLRVRQDLYDEEYSDADYEQMLSMYEGTMAQIVEGEIVKSKVLRVTENAVILDVGFKSEGSVPLDEFKDPQSLKEGDEVEVFLEHLEDQEGAVVLSKKKADFMRVWEKIRVAHESDQPVEGTLVKKIKGGVVVNLMGVDAFLPGSQIALRRVPNIGALMFLPYLRVIPMHLAILLGVALGDVLGRLLFGTLKTVADVAMHKIEHRWLQRAAAAKPVPRVVD